MFMCRVYLLKFYERTLPFITNVTQPSADSEQRKTTVWMAQRKM